MQLIQLWLQPNVAQNRSEPYSDGHTMLIIWNLRGLHQFVHAQMWSHPSAHYIDAQMFRNSSLSSGWHERSDCRSDCLILIRNVRSVLHRQGARVEKECQGSGLDMWERGLMLQR